MNDFHKPRGFTLIEVVMALAIGVTILGAISAVVVMGQRAAGAIEGKVAAQADVRGALELMAIEIAMASCNPTMAPNLWVHPTNCTTSPSPTAVYRGIQEATPTAITVEMDIDDSRTVGDNPNVLEVIRYAYDAANQYITRNANCLGAQPFLGDNPATGQPRVVRVLNNTLPINNGSGAPAIFRYYNGGSPGIELYPGVTPADIPNIRRIDITLAVETEQIDTNTGQRRRLIYSTSVIPRNHSINAY